MTNVGFIISRFTVYLFAFTVAFNMFFVYATIDAALYKKIYYLSNELINTSLIYSVFAIFIGLRLKFCLANWISIFGLISLNIFNIISILTKGSYNVYDSILGQISIMVIALLSIILLLRNKKKKP